MAMTSTLQWLVDDGKPLLTKLESDMAYAEKRTKFRVFDPHRAG
jgi:hypothetical protein